ncbi:MAG: hypothetical protein JNM89_11015 [Hyphomicrobiaceae bacterium]|nr:hypothetical protein [Hyphomicrobiaceae bacterium]
MIRFLYVVAVLICATLPAAAATVQVNEGTASVSRGDGFQPASSGTQVGAGDKVLVSEGSSVTIIYSPGCQVSVSAGQVVTIPAEAPCLAGVVESAPATMGMTGYVIGGVVIAGAVGAAVGLSGGGGGHSP